jgi:hypothetical protein
MSNRKIMCTVFWDRLGILLVKFLPRGTTINAAVYCETLNKLWCTIQNKRCNMLSVGVAFLHNTHAYLLLFKHASCLLHSNGSWWIIPLTDFQLFLHLKRFLVGEKFDRDEKLKENVEKWLMSQVADF